MASSTPIHTLNSDDLQITVAQELFHRLQLRREPLATMQCEDRPAEPQVPRAWLERLRRGEGGGMVSCRLPHDPPSPSTPEQDEEEEEEEASPQMAVHPLPLEAWITKLQARTMEADWPRRREEAPCGTARETWALSARFLGQKGSRRIEATSEGASRGSPGRSDNSVLPATDRVPARTSPVAGTIRFSPQWDRQNR